MKNYSQQDLNNGLWNSYTSRADNIHFLKRSYHCALLDQFSQYLISESACLAEDLAEEDVSPSPRKIQAGSKIKATSPNSDLSEPFLSIVTRTQGRRPDGLREVFLSLTGQSCQDFEVVLVGHRLDAAAAHTVQAIIDETAAWLRARIRLIRVDHGNRTTPLNIGFQESLGRYVAILDDDDLVFANWVETFKELELTNSGAVIRAMAVTQDYEEIQTKFGGKCSRAVSTPKSIYPSTFQLLDHLRSNQTPPVALAFPRCVFSELGFRFDETLTTTEDWDYLIRATTVCGVASAPVVTSIYRQWINRENSQTVHSKDEWIKNHNCIFAKNDQAPLLLPAGATKMLRDLLDERDHLRNAIKTLDEQCQTLRLRGATTDYAGGQNRESELVVSGNTELLRGHVQAIFTSTSWKITLPLRLVARLVKGEAVYRPNLDTMSAEELQDLIFVLRESTSWQFTSVIRRSVPIFRRLINRGPNPVIRSLH